ncbi:hypothetical protein HDE_06819 [Halotydeus destructor]|nr:hypothetical protein HDE_06819 [Halotydeus destructor]
MFLVCKLTDFKRSQQDQSKRKVTEKELTHLNHKIDKLLVKLEEHEPELAASTDEECVICISAKATMQTFPCGHRVVCRKCFVKTIQVAVSQRLLPLRCVICRAKILRLKQTTSGGIVTGAVLRSKAASSASGHHYSSSSASSSSLSSSLSSSSPPFSPLVSSNPFYISPATSPVSPVTEVFREQRAVWVKNYDSFDFGSNGHSPSPLTPSSTNANSKSSLSLSSGCVLHKHCSSRNSIQDGRSKSAGTSPTGSTAASAFSLTSSSSYPGSPADGSPGGRSGLPLTTSLSAADLDLASAAILGLPPSRSRSSPNPWQFQFNKKKRHRISHRRRRQYGASGRPNTLLLPIDEHEELFASSRSASPASRKDGRPRVAPLAESDDDDFSSLGDLAEDSEGTGSGSETDSEAGSGSTGNTPTRRASSTGLIDASATDATSPGKPKSPGRTKSRLSIALRKAKNFVSKGKWTLN